MTRYLTGSRSGIAARPPLVCARRRCRAQQSLEHQGCIPYLWPVRPADANTGVTVLGPSRLCMAASGSTSLGSFRHANAWGGGYQRPVAVFSSNAITSHKTHIYSGRRTGSRAVCASVKARRSWAVPLLQLLCAACPEDAWLLLCDLSDGLKDSRPTTCPANIGNQPYSKPHSRHCTPMQPSRSGCSDYYSGLKHALAQLIGQCSPLTLTAMHCLR